VPSKALSKAGILLVGFGYNRMWASVRKLMARAQPGSGRCRGNEVRSDHELLGSLPFMMQRHPMRKEGDSTVGALRVSPMSDNRVCAWEGTATRALICRTISPFCASQARLDNPRSRVRVPRPPSLTAWLQVLRQTRSAAVARLARLGPTVLVKAPARCIRGSGAVPPGPRRCIRVTVCQCSPATASCRYGSEQSFLNRRAPVLAHPAEASLVLSLPSAHLGPLIDLAFDVASW
jgi:hypothetical protein